MTPDQPLDPAPIALAATIDAHATITRNVSVMTAQATHDAELLALWLHGRSVSTQDAYRRDIDRFQRTVGIPLHQVRLGDLQAFADTLQHLAPASRKRILSAIKSLFAFGQKVGYLQYNVGAALILPKGKNTIGERILSEDDVHRILELETDPRNHLILMLLYATGGSANTLFLLAQRAFDFSSQTTSGDVRDTLSYADLVRCEGLLWALSAQEVSDRYQIDRQRAPILAAGASCRWRTLMTGISPPRPTTAPATT